MEQANSKIMGRIAEIENCVLGGFVLDDRGNWISIADKKASEEDFLVHLEAGRVLHGGKWVHFEDVKKTPVKRQEISPFTPSPAASSPIPDPSPEEETDSGLYPPETKAIQILSPFVEKEEPAIDPESGYAPETGLFTVENIPAAVPANPGHRELKRNPPPVMAMETRETKHIPALTPPSIPSWGKEDFRPRKHTLIIGVIIIVLTTVAATVAIMLQIL